MSALIASIDESIPREGEEEMNTTTVNETTDKPADVRQAAEEYRSLGLAVCRIRPGEKSAKGNKWQTRSAEPDDFEPGEGVGLVCGWPSDGGQRGRYLVCVDLDDDEAITKAAQFLPPTGAIEGRESKQRAHWLYFTTDVPSSATSTGNDAAIAAAEVWKLPGPKSTKFARAGVSKSVIDFLATGRQVVVPPSLNPSGEWRRWEEGCSIDQIATYPFTELWEAVTRLAESCGAKRSNVDPPPTTSEMGEADTNPASASAASAGQVQGTCTRECDVPMEERERRCERYLQEVELARSGHGGHDTTYRVAMIICNDFAVTNREAALTLMRFYNERLRVAGEETWSEGELAHKIDDALKAPVDPGHPWGCKLRERTDDTSRVWNDPARLATEFLREHTVRFVKKSAFFYTDGSYQVVSDEWLAATVRGFVERASDREYRRRGRELQSQFDTLRAQTTAPIREGESDDTVIAARRAARAELKRLEKAPSVVAPKVGIGLVLNTIASIAVRAQLPDDAEVDSWIDGRSAAAVLAVANGLLDPVARTLFPHTPDWFATAKLPVAHNADAPTPERWLTFLNEVMEGDADRIAVLQELFGASLDRSYPAKWFAALVGSGDNGKSVCLAVLRFLLGAGNCSAVNLDELSTNRFAAFALFGKLGNIVGDQGHFESSDEGRLKTLTGGDLVTFEQKGRDSFVAVNRAKLIFACNTMPSFSDKSEAVWNRLIAVPFEFTVPAEKKNPALLTAAYWTDELPGILNWALDGLARLREQGRFTRSVKCEAMKNRTRLDSNPARLFLLAGYEFTGEDAHAVRVKELYEEYLTWCKSSGFTKPLTKPKFGREVRSAFPQLPESKVVAAKEGTPQHRAWLGLHALELTEGA